MLSILLHIKASSMRYADNNDDDRNNYYRRIFKAIK